MSNIKQLSDTEWLLLRPQNIIGSVQEVRGTDFFLNDNNKFEFVEYNYIPGFIKIINEIIDNSIDVYVKSNGKSANQISIDISDDTVIIKDNGYGIPVEKNDDGEWLPYICWGKARAGSNFNDSENKGQIGMNGIGSFASVVFSDEFVGISDDGKNKIKVTFKNNASSYKINELTSNKNGVEVRFKPDLQRFGLTKINDIHIKLIYQRLLNLAVTYPDIKFTFNKKKVSIKVKDYLSFFSDKYEVIEDDKYFIGVMPSDDDFRFMTYVNGLHIVEGGNHINYILDKISGPIRDKLQRKYKNIKPSDIKNKLQLVIFFKGFINPSFNSQTKEKLTNTSGEISEFLGDIQWEKFTNKIYKNKDILDPIVDIYRLKEEFKKRQELKKLGTTKKNIKSEKYLPPIGNNKYLVICEGQSARSGLSKTLGRKEFGYYELKGKPLNAYDNTQQKFTANKELSELYQIINNENYEYIIFGTDQDLDGYAIRGLLLGFFKRYLPELLESNRVGVLSTPIVALSKNNKITHWYYNLSDVDEELYNKYTSKYYKGLGSWEQKDLQYIIDKDGIEKMIALFTLSDTTDKIIDDWLNKDSAHIRKEYIITNEFSLIKL